MRFTISREKLQEGLNSVAASIPAKTTLPVLAYILVETTERGIRLSGTDRDIAVSTEVSADVETPGAITIPAKKLQEIARELPPNPAQIAAAGEQRGAPARGGAGRGGGRCRARGGSARRSRASSRPTR